MSCDHVCFQLCSSVRLCSLRVFEYCTNILASDICENTIFLITRFCRGLVVAATVNQNPSSRFHVVNYLCLH